MYNVLKENGYDIADNHKLIGRVPSSKLKEIIYDFFTDESNKPDDTLVFYYSGHGVPDKFGKTFLAPSDMHSEHPFKTGFSFDDLTDAMLACNSLRIVTILDSCFSGSLKIGKGLGAELESKSSEEAAAQIANAIVEEKSNKLKQGIGRCLLASSQGYEEAYDRQEKDHSIFTYYLLEGLKGHKNAVDEEGNVTYDTLGKFVSREIGNLPSDKRPHQTPVRKGEVSGGEIVLAQYPKLKKFRKEEYSATLFKFLRTGQVDEFNAMRKEVPLDVSLDFSSQDLYRVQIPGADLSSINLSRVNLFNADLEGANLTNANLLKADLEGANLHNVEATNAIMEGANLTKTNLTKANLTRTNLTNADLSKSNLYRTNLAQARLVGADLREADISECNIREADTTAAIFRNNNAASTSGTPFNMGTRISSSNYQNNSIVDDVTKDTANNTNFVTEEKLYKQSQQPDTTKARTKYSSDVDEKKEVPGQKETQTPTPTNYEYNSIQPKGSGIPKFAFIGGALGAAAVLLIVIAFTFMVPPTPATDTAVTDTPATDTAVTDTPATDTAVTDTPATDTAPTTTTDTTPTTTTNSPLNLDEFMRLTHEQNSTGGPPTTNTPPKVFDSTVTTIMDQPVSIQLKASDVDTNTDLTASIVAQPTNGQLSEIDQKTGTVTYTPNSGYIGTDEFTFNAHDGQESSDNTGIVKITVS
jgi:uncharacterized protein YjbI with pentapeptide repeats